MELNKQKHLRSNQVAYTEFISCSLELENLLLRHQLSFMFALPCRSLNKRVLDGTEMPCFLQGRKILSTDVLPQCKKGYHLFE